MFSILALPLCLAGLCLLIKKSRLFSWLNVFGHLTVLIFAAVLAGKLVKTGQPLAILNFFYLDSLSAFFIFTIAVVNFASAIYSVEYIRRDLAEGIISEKKARLYYLLFNLFAFTMLFVPVINNLGMLWVAIEMTTLVSAFLVGFYNNKESIEAAWKYIVICSVGITLALFGTILIYYTASFHGGIKSLNWTEIMAVTAKLDPKILKVAFLFILVGYGTKAGLAPMHNWLPDAHSQALAPISALLSGVLLKTAVYAILRFLLIVNKAAAISYTSHLLIFFGLLSLAVSAGFILVQKDVKRLLAYSSVEHLGLIALGLGLGGVWGITGAVFHVFNHAVTKSLMFFAAGNLVRKYKTHNMHLMRGALRALPFTGVVLLLGVFALGGLPPFSIFISEFMILLAGFLGGSYLVISSALLFLVIIFSGLIYHFSKIIFGKEPADLPVEKEPLSGKIAFSFLFIFIIVLGVAVPDFFQNLLISAAAVIKGS